MAVGVFWAWLALSGFEPLIAAATDKLHLAVSLGEYRLQWPLGPAALGIVGLVLSWVRYRFFPGGPQLQDRLHRAALLAVVLLALRLVSLLDPIVLCLPLPDSALVPARAVGCGACLYGLRASAVLANNLGAEQIGEFHVSHFAVPKAPASPKGKVHSVHPIGLSVALVPAYWWGLEKWQNPRLAAALFMALLASLCVPLTFLYLTRLGVELWAALLATGIMAVTGPFFYYTNQLYPEVPALLISLIGLLALAHWQMPGGSYRSWGRWEVPLLGLLTLLLCCLPFLHPRLAPLGLLCGAGVLLQVLAQSPGGILPFPWSAWWSAQACTPLSPSTTPSAATGWVRSVQAVVPGGKTLSISPIGASPCPATCSM